jgi:broad-specificity NMP kinase
MEKEAVILKGIPGCGKSTVAKMIAGETGSVHEADSFFYDDEGNYNFDFKLLGKAHMQCLANFTKDIEAGVPRVIQSNTNTSLKAYKDYMKVAKDNGYKVTVMVVENHHGGENIHGVPQEALERMETQLKNSLHISYQGDK